MPFAVKLSESTVELISDRTLQSQREVREELDLATTLGETRYFILNITINNISYPWVNMREDYFWEHFATMPKGIDERFVKVTQVKSP